MPNLSEDAKKWRETVNEAIVLYVSFNDRKQYLLERLGGDYERCRMASMYEFVIRGKLVKNEN